MFKLDQFNHRERPNFSGSGPTYSLTNTFYNLRRNACCLCICDANLKRDGMSGRRTRTFTENTCFSVIAPLKNVLFWARSDFPISFSNRDIPRNVLNRLLGSYVVGTGILSNNMRSPSPECYTAFWMMTIYSGTLHWSDFTPILTLLLIWTLLPNLTFFLFVWGFHRTFAIGAASMPTEYAYSYRHLVLPLFSTCLRSNVETNLSLTCLVSGLSSFEHPSVLLFCLYNYMSVNVQIITIMYGYTRKTITLPNSKHTEKRNIFVLFYCA